MHYLHQQALAEIRAAELQEQARQARLTASCAG
jgi:hypothetical protein